MQRASERCRGFYKLRDMQARYKGARIPPQSSLRFRHPFSTLRIIRFFSHIHQTTRIQGCHFRPAGDHRRPVDTNVKPRRRAISRQPVTRGQIIPTTIGSAQCSAHLTALRHLVRHINCSRVRRISRCTRPSHPNACQHHAGWPAPGYDLPPSEICTRFSDKPQDSNVQLNGATIVRSLVYGCRRQAPAQ
jgi:hypothetical protein